MPIQNPNTEAVLLLTAYFNSKELKEHKPLTNTEYARFAVWLKENDLSPSDLLSADIGSSLSGWEDRKITPDRISFLLERGMSLALVYEKWENSGIWVLSRADAQYPSLLKERLGQASPPILFGAGNKAILKTKAVGVVGSRDAMASDLEATEEIGKRIADAGYSVVSGGAKGVDQASMLGALSGEGTVIGILTDGLASASRSGRYREHIISKNLVLLSLFHPDARFSVANAMARNKYIYTLSKTTIVIHSKGSGGTWSGATENLKKRWVPLLVFDSADPEAANSKLIERGGIQVGMESITLEYLEKVSFPPENMIPEEQTSFMFTADRAVSDSEKGKPAETYEANKPNLTPTSILLDAFEQELLSILEKYQKVPIDSMVKYFQISHAQFETWLSILLKRGNVIVIDGTELLTHNRE